MRRRKEPDGTTWVRWSGQWWLKEDNGWWSKWEPTESDTESSTDETDLLHQAQEVVNHQMSSDLSSLELEDDQSGSNPEQVPIDVQDIKDSMAMIGIN